MKLLRVGQYNKERVAALDSNNIIRDLSSHIQDLNPSTLNESTFTNLSKLFLGKYEIRFRLIKVKNKDRKK